MVGQIQQFSLNGKLLSAVLFMSQNSKYDIDARLNKVSPMSHLSRFCSGLVLNSNLEKEHLLKSMMCINGMKLLRYAEENKGIQLTKSGALFRKCVTWAAEEFQWPGYEPEELYRFNKVLNQQDFPPVSVMHDLMVAAKLMRHFKGKAILTKSGQQLLGNYSALQIALFETWFTRFDFDYYDRFGMPAIAGGDDYGHFFGVITNRSSDWISLANLTHWCIPVDMINQYHISPLDEACWHLSSRLIRPLNWLGLLEVDRGDRLSPFSEQTIRKTKLFDEFLKFPNAAEGHTGLITVH